MGNGKSYSGAKKGTIGYGKSYDYYDDYYGGSSYGSGYGGYGGYGSSYSRSYGSSYSSGFNWGSFGSYSFNEDDDKNLYIKNHESYFTPTSSDISSKIQYKSDTKKNKDLIKEMARYFYYKMIDDKDYFDEKYSDLDRLTESEIAEFGNKKQFYDELWDKFVPGVTPLEKALAMFSKLNEENKSGGDVDQSQMLEQVSGIDFHEEIYADPIFNELMDTNHFSKKHKMDILNKLSLIQNLGSEFKVEKEIDEKIVANSSIITKKIIRDYSQLYNVELYQRLMPTFDIKLLTKDLIVNVPVDRTEHKQKIIILVDFSGSMCCQDKQQWVVATMMDRLRYAVKEEAEIFFSYFVHNPNVLRFTHVYNRETALEFWKEFSTNPNGGDTNVGGMVDKIKSEIEEKGRLMNLNVDLSADKPEILVINDGQDDIKTSKFSYKTNALTLVDGENKQLKELCVNNHGKYVYIGGNCKEAITYSKEGTQKIKI